MAERRGRPRAADPHVHGHWTKLTSAQERAWDETTKKLSPGPLRPQDSAAVRFAMGFLAKSFGFEWPEGGEGSSTSSDASAEPATPEPVPKDSTVREKGMLVGERVSGEAQVWPHGMLPAHLRPATERTVELDHEAPRPGHPKRPGKR